MRHIYSLCMKNEILKMVAEQVATAKPSEALISTGSPQSEVGMPVAVLNQCVSGPLPEFGRWQDVQRHFGIKRSTLYRLIADGKIRSITLREPGRKFGCRLIHLQSVREHLHAVLAKQRISEAL